MKKEKIITVASLLDDLIPANRFTNKKVFVCANGDFLVNGEETSNFSYFAYLECKEYEVGRWTINGDSIIINGKKIEKGE